MGGRERKEEKSSDLEKYTRKMEGFFLLQKELESWVFVASFEVSLMCFDKKEGMEQETKNLQNL